MRTDNLEAPNTHPNIWSSIIAWGKGHQPSNTQRQAITDWELSDPDRRNAWHPKAHPPTLESNQQVTEALASRAALLQSVVQSIATHPQEQSLPLAGAWTDWIVPLWTFWLPLAQQLDQQQRAHKAPFVQGILGGQGTGKTTLTRILNLMLAHLGQRSVGLSIDDLYLTYAQRLALKQQDPRFIWRGPPGTHDIELGVQTLAQIKQASPTGTGTGTETGTVMVPQFDKSLHEGQGDRTSPLIISAPTIVLFEGWLVGTQPVTGTVFTAGNPLPDPIVSAADRKFAAECNRKLHDYLPLWNQLDSLIVLTPTDYRRSRQWRQQAERAMKAQGKSGLSDEVIVHFVTYFWKALHPELFITPLTRTETADSRRNRAIAANLVVAIGKNHSIDRIYRP